MEGSLHGSLRMRTKIDDTAREILEAWFAASQFPSREDLECLARACATSTRTVRVWFQNKRQRHKLAPLKLREYMLRHLHRGTLYASDEPLHSHLLSQPLPVVCANSCDVIFALFVCDASQRTITFSSEAASAAVDPSCPVAQECKRGTMFGA